MKTKKLKEFITELKNFDFSHYDVNHISIRNNVNPIPNARELHRLGASWDINSAIEKMNGSNGKTYYITNILYHSSNKGTDFKKIIEFLIKNLTHTAGNEYGIDYSKSVPTNPKLKSPVDYGKIVKNDCASNECKLKYGKDGCGFNITTSREMQKNPKLNFFWSHDKKEEKVYSFNKNFSGLDVIFVPDNYIFEIGKENGKVILDFGLKFTEYGGLIFPKENKEKIVAKLKSYGFKEKK